MIPESTFYLEGQGGLFEFIEQRLKDNGHMVIVVAEGAGQEYVAQSMHSAEEKDASGNRLLHDIGPWLSHKIKVDTNSLGMELSLVWCFESTYLYLG